MDFPPCPGYSRRIKVSDLALDFFTNLSFPQDTMMEEMKPLVTSKNEFDNSDESVIVAQLIFLEYQDSDTWMQINGFAIES